MSSLAPPTVSWDHRWTETELAAWRAGIAAALEGEQGGARRAAARREDVQVLRVRSPEQVTALVVSSRGDVSHAELALEEGQVSGSCDCPHGEQHFECKHVWAVLDRLDAALAGVAPQGGSATPAEPAPEADLGSLARALDAALEPEPEARACGTSRIVWHAHFEPHVLVEPVEQQVSALGEWTGGRRVPLHELDAKARSASAAPDVRAVGRLIERDALDGRLALEALEGAPNVVRADAPERPLAVRRGDVRLALCDAPGGLRLEPQLDGRRLASGPEPTCGAVAALHEEDDLVLVGRVPRQARAVVDLLLRGALPIPLDDVAASSLLARASQLELPVHVPPELPAAAVEADARLRLVLEAVRREAPSAGDGPPPVAEPPAVEGLRARLGVRPLGRDDVPSDVFLQPGRGPAQLLCVEDQGLARARRDLAGEARRAKDALRQLGLAPAPAWSWDLDLEAGLALLAALRDAPPPGLVVEWPRGEALRVSPELAPSACRVTVRNQRDWFELDGSIDVGGERIPLAVVLEALRRGDRHVRLADGRFLRLSEELRARLEALGGVARPRGDALELDATAAPVVADALAGVGGASLCKPWREVMARLDASRSLAVRPPRALRAKLRRYQREGYAWLKRLSAFGTGACLADDMGLGKTVQTIGVMLDRAGLGPALVVAPTSVATNWARELRHFAPTLRPVLLRDTTRDVDAIEALGPGDVLIASYDLARIDIAILWLVTWSTLVLDEAQRVKNARTKTAESIALLQAKWRIALTGTPVENRLSDLWSVFRIVSPGLLGSWPSFRDRFAVPIERDRDAVQAAALARLLRPYVLRRTKEQVLTELPPRTETTLEVTLGKDERALYEDTRLAAAAHLKALLAASRSRGREARFHVLAALTRLRQLACHPRLVDEGWTGSSAKLDLLLELVRELADGGHRALVFSQFTAHLALVREALDAAGLGYHYLDGATRARERQLAIDAFQAGDRPLFLISLKAGGVGLNLTGADYVVHLDPWWNPAVEDQATGRAHRIGQSKPVTVYRLVAQDTVEERILDLHADKRDLVTAVLDGTEKAGALSTDELVSLIRGEADDAVSSRRPRGAKKKVAATRPPAAKAKRPAPPAPSPTAPKASGAGRRRGK